MGLPVNVALWGDVIFISSLSDEDPSLTVSLAVLVVLGLSFYLNIALNLRRLHDRGRSAWWLLLLFGVPIAASVMLAMSAGETLSGFAVVPLFGPVLRGLIDLGARRGVAGPNRYGPDPAGRVRVEVFD